MNRKSNISRRRNSALQDGGSDYLAKRAELTRIAAEHFKHRGFRAASLAEIGRKAGMDRATVYYYFGSKEEIFRECLRNSVDSNIQECFEIFDDKALSSREKLDRVIHQLMHAYDANYPHMYVYIQEEMERIASEKSLWAQQLMEQTRRFEQIVIQLLVDLRKSGEIRNDIAVSIMANAIFGMLNWTHRWYRPGGPHSAREISDGFVKIFFEGIVTD